MTADSASAATRVRIPPTDLLPDGQVTDLAEAFHRHVKAANEARQALNDTQARTAIREAADADQAHQAQQARDGITDGNHTPNEDKRRADAITHEATWQRNAAAAEQILDELRAALTEAAPNQYDTALAAFEQAHADYRQTLDTVKDARTAFVSAAYVLGWWSQVERSGDVAFDSRYMDPDQTMPMIRIGDWTMNINQWTVLVDRLETELVHVHRTTLRAAPVRPTA